MLWEFWNMWAFTKWIYIFPLGQDWKFFEMPLVGFLGFLPFALEYFVMFHFIASFFTPRRQAGAVTHSFASEALHLFADAQVRRFGSHARCALHPVLC